MVQTCIQPYVEFTTTSLKSYFCLTIDSWGQLWPKPCTPLLSTFEWDQAPWSVPCFLWRQVRATSDVCGSRTGVTGNCQEEHRAPARQAEVTSPSDKEVCGHGASERCTLISTTLPMSNSLLLPWHQGGVCLHVDCKTKDFNVKCCFAENQSTLMMFSRIAFFFPYILTLCLTFQWLLFKLPSAELQNVVFVLKTTTENFICIQMPTGLWYFNNKTAGLKAHDEKSD